MAHQGRVAIVATIARSARRLRLHGRVAKRRGDNVTDNCSGCDTDRDVPAAYPRRIPACVTERNQ